MSEIPKVSELDLRTTLLEGLHLVAGKINDSGLKHLLDYARFLANERPREPRDGYGKVIAINGWQGKPITKNVCGTQGAKT